jgi:hypothetical protein
MKKDFFNYCCSATGDILNASGDVFNPPNCTLDAPYTDEELKGLRDTLSVATNNKAMAIANYQKCDTELKACLRKLFCPHKPKQERFDLAITEKKIAIAAYNSAKEEFNRADQQNKAAKAQYNICNSQQIDYIKAQPNQNVSASAPESTGSNYIKYGLIGIGVVTVLVFGYLKIKK